MAAGINLLKGSSCEGGPAQDAVFARHDAAAGLHISADELRGDITALDILSERLVTSLAMYSAVIMAGSGSNGIDYREERPALALPSLR